MQTFIKVFNLLADDEAKAKARRAIVSHTPNPLTGEVGVCFVTYDTNKPVNPDFRQADLISNHSMSIEEARNLARALMQMADKAESQKTRFQIS